MVSHQPVAWMSERGRNEVTRSPIVGASQMTATIPRPMWIGVLFRRSRIRPLNVEGPSRLTRPPGTSGESLT